MKNYNAFSKATAQRGILCAIYRQKKEAYSASFLLSSYEFSVFQSFWSQIAT